MIMVLCFMTLILSCHSATHSNIAMPICLESFTCPGLTPFSYPFYNVTDTRCGLVNVNCTSVGAEIQFGGRPYEVFQKFDIDYHSSILSFRNSTFEKLVKNNSCEALTNNIISPSPSPLLYSISLFNSLYSPIITLFKCTKNVTYFEQHNYKSYNSCKDHTFYYNFWNGTVPSDLPHACQVVQLPVKVPGPGFDETDIFSLLYNGTSVFFNLSHSCSECWEKGRLCDTQNGHDVHCLDIIRDKPGTKQTSIPYTVSPSTERTDLERLHRNKTIKILVIAGSALILILAFVIFKIIIWRHFLGVEKRETGWRKKAKYNVKFEMFLKNHEFLAPKRFSYAQVEKMTNSFKFELGQGGFGTVYKGVLRNQNLVAVKVLSELKGDGEDFINEVASVGRTSHVNIASLIGFCLEGRKKALIYEFMPNGSLERFIYNRDSSNSSHIGWEKLNQIARITHAS